jgi:FlaA1/EpsC-like NDP-sugar epimerase
MTIPEACQLVLEAGSMGRGGEIFVFDMGEPVRIFDLANKMIQMAGLIPGVDIEIKITGLRPGEKLDEEVLHEGENIVDTHHPKIHKAMVRPQDPEQVATAIAQLICLANTGGTPEGIVAQMKVLVPEFISQNSSFSALDHECSSEEAGTGSKGGASRAPLQEEIV